MLDDAVRQAVDDSVLCWLATVDADGAPNVSPKELFVSHVPDQLLIANIASPGSVHNIKHNPQVCVSFVDVFKQKGFKVKGRATIIGRTDSTYAALLTHFDHLGGQNFPIKSIIVVAIQSVSAIVAPSYWLNPDTTEESQIEQSLRTYGVRR
jgi:predicted pyridoxine 5'-phosphate oxidase superfamily flavin-nucleotide-binding protein